MSRERHKTGAFLLGETMVALAVLFLLFMVLTGASMSAYSTSVRVSQRARAEDILSTSVATIERDIKSWTPDRTETHAQKLGDVEYQIQEESKELSPKLLQVKITVSWRIQSNQQHVEKTFVRSLKEAP